MRMLRDTRGQWGLIEIVVVVAVIVILAAVIMPRYLGGRAPGSSKEQPSPVDRAHSAECMSYLSQVRSAVTMYESSNGAFPSSMAELSSYGVSDSLMKCPVSGTPYVYDPGSGRTWCSTPGHEKF